MIRSLLVLAALVLSSFALERLVRVFEPEVAATGPVQVTLDGGPAVGPGVFRTAELRLVGGAADLDVRWTWRLEALDATASSSAGDWRPLELPALRVRVATQGGQRASESIAVVTFDGAAGVQRFDAAVLERGATVRLVAQVVEGGFLVQPAITGGAGTESVRIDLGPVGPLWSELAGHLVLPEVLAAQLVDEGLGDGTLARCVLRVALRDASGARWNLALAAAVARAAQP